MKFRKNSQLPWYIVLLFDILALSLALIVFSLFHHALPSAGGEPTKVIDRGQLNPEPNAAPINDEGMLSIDPTPTPTPSAALPSATAAPTPVPTIQPLQIGDFSLTFPAEPTDDEATLHSYQSDNVRIAVRETKITKGVKNTYYVADIWVRDISNLKTAFASGVYGRSIKAYPNDIAKENNAILAINGDYYGARSRGVVIRNGEVYRESVSSDVCVIYYDGTMQTYYQNDFDINDAIANGAYQAWGFGPKLIDDGAPVTDFNTDVMKENPRTAIGYYEPGHYCFVAVNGRQKDARGMTLDELANLMVELGCKDAFNLDGGQTSMMVFDDTLVNAPFHDGRECSDIVYIAEEN